MRRAAQGTNAAYCLELFCVKDCKTACSPENGTLECLLLCGPKGTTLDPCREFTSVQVSCQVGGGPVG